MSKLPVLFIIQKSFSFLALDLGKLLHWMLVPLGVSLAAACVGYLAYRLTGSWLPAVPCVLLASMAWIPFVIQVNQQCVLGRTQTGQYLARIFQPQSLKFLTFALAVQAITTLGLLIALAPAGLAGLANGFGEMNPRLALGVMVSMVLGASFMILISPLKLIYPSVAVESQPSLGKAYNLGAENKLRLFLTWLLPGMFFFVLSSSLDHLAGFFGSDDSLAKVLIILPAQLIILGVNLLVNLVIPAMAYRFLARLEEPEALERPRTPPPLGS